MATRCGLSVPETGDPWLSNITARLRESGVDGWNRMLASVEASPFLCGENERRFKADLDWLVKPKNFGKALSGKYADGSRKSDPSTTSPAMPPFWWQVNPRAPAKIGSDQWRQLIRSHSNRDWPVETLGPAPGTPGCVVPADVIRELHLTEGSPQ